MGRAALPSVLLLVAGCLGPPGAPGGDGAPPDGAPGDGGRDAGAPDPEAPVQIAAGYQHSCARCGDGRITCWGLNDSGQLGDHQESDPERSPVPVAVLEEAGGDPLRGAIEVATGFLHTCARKLDGTVWCWGADGSGQLGDGGELAGSLAPVPVMTADGALLAGAVDIAAGGHHGCALVAGGSLWCWGSNAFGQLGVEGWTGAEDRRPAAVEVAVPDGVELLELAAGGEHTCAVGRDTASGTRHVWCWGRNNLGQIGAAEPGDMENRLTPVMVLREPDEAGTTDDIPLGGAARVGAGNRFSCAAADSPDELLCWGENKLHALGDDTLPEADHGATAWKARSTVIDLTEPVAEIGGGEAFACARLASGLALCWGGNDVGQLGRSSESQWEGPARVGAGGEVVAATGLAVGFAHACALTEKGEVLCWGDNSRGQLGDGTLTMRDAPVPVESPCAVER